MFQIHYHLAKMHGWTTWSSTQAQSLTTTPSSDFDYYRKPGKKGVQRPMPSQKSQAKKQTQGVGIGTGTMRHADQRRMRDGRTEEGNMENVG